MKKQARTKSPGRSKKALADLVPRNTAGLKGGGKSNIAEVSPKLADQIVQNIRG